MTLAGLSETLLWQALVPRVGLVRYATSPRAVAEPVPPRSARPPSKQTYTQPQLLAVLLLMRDDGSTFRSAEARTPYRTPMVCAVPRGACRPRVLVEAPFSAATRTRGGVAPARSERQIEQAHLLGGSFNVARLRPAA